MSNLFLDGTKLFYHLDSLYNWSKNIDFPPVHIEISPTNACNYRCKFCYADFTGHKGIKIDKHVFIRLMKDLGEIGVKSCLLAGDGEPTLVKDCIDAIRIGKESGVDMAFNTNGVLFDENWANETLSYLTWIRFSLMAATPDIFATVHGTSKRFFSKVLKNISKCVEIKSNNKLDTTIGIQQVLLPENAHEVLELAKISKDIGVDYFVLKPFSLHEGNNNYKNGISAVELRDKHEELFHKAESLSDDNFSCLIRWNTFKDDGIRTYDRCLGLPFIAQIAADSHVYTCCPFFYRDIYSYGNLKEKNFKEIWFSDKAKKIRKDISENLDVHKECMSYCRHHQVNIKLWELKKPPDHLNFI